MKIYINKKYSAFVLSGLLLITVVFSVVQLTTASPDVEFYDTFTEDVNTTLASHTPDTGTGWQVLIQVGGGTMRVSALNDVVRRENGGLNDGVLYQTQNIMSSPDYKVTIKQLDGERSDDTCIIAARIQDANNMYAFKWNKDSGQLYKRVGGAWLPLGAGTGGIADGSIVKLKVEGTTISVEDDGVEIVSVADSSHSGAGRAGLGMGAVITPGNDMDNQRFDDFQVNITVPPNQAPTITSVSDDSSKPGNSDITFTSQSSDPDGDLIKLYICKDSSCTNCGPEGGTSGCWAVTDTGVEANPSATYTCPSCGYSTNNYYAQVCDNNGACSGIITNGDGSFTCKKEDGCDCSIDCPSDGDCEACYGGYCCGGSCQSNPCVPGVTYSRTATAIYEVLNNPPSAINLSASPEGICFLIHPFVRLSWTFDDPDLASGDYQSAREVEIFSDPGYNNLVNRIPEPDLSPGSTEYTPNTGLSFNADYYWRARVWDSESTLSDCGQSEGWCYPEQPSFHTEKERPRPDFSVTPPTQRVHLKERVEFTDESTCYDGPCNLSPTANYLWEFGDGGTSSEQGNTSHIYLATGNYDATLTITDEVGKCTSDPITIIVTLPLPEWMEIPPF